MQHAASQLLEVRKDITSTLQTLRTNLMMAKVIGNVDAETLKLSLGLIAKASTRIIASFRQVASAAVDAALRGQQCCKLAKSVVAFASGRRAADEAAADDAPKLALPAPEGCEWTEPSQSDSAGQVPRSSPKSAAPASSSPTRGGGGNEFSQKDAGASTTTGPNPKVLLDARLQNDRLLRQLNSELLGLQKRARAYLGKPHGATLIGAIPAEARKQTFTMVAEVISAAVEAIVSEIGDCESCKAVVDCESNLRVLLKRHFGFLEACSDDIAMPLDVRVQLVRLAALFDAQPILAALDKQAKPRIAGCFADIAEETRGYLIKALDRQFDLLANAVVAARMS